MAYIDYLKEPLTNQEKLAIQLREKGLTFKEIADQMPRRREYYQGTIKPMTGLSIEWTRQIYQRAKRKIRHQNG